MRYALLIIWLVLEFALDVFLMGGAIYLVMWRHCSGWWIVLALILMCRPAIFKVLKQEFKPPPVVSARPDPWHVTVNAMGSYSIVQQSNKPNVCVATIYDEAMAYRIALCLNTI